MDEVKKDANTKVKQRRTYDLVDLAIIGAYNIFIFTLGTILAIVWSVLNAKV